MQNNPFEGLQEDQFDIPEELKYSIVDNSIKSYTDGVMWYDYRTINQLDLLEYGAKFYLESMNDVLEVSRKTLTPESRAEIIQEITDSESLSPEEKSDRIAELNAEAEEEEETTDEQKESNQKSERQEREDAIRAVVLKNIIRVYKKDLDGKETDIQMNDQVKALWIKKMHLTLLMELYTIFCGGGDAENQAFDAFPEASEEDSTTSSEH